MTNRPALPTQLRRDLLIESGYRCAMPHCRETEIDIHHIVDYAKGGTDTFDNLIALCPNCHRRVTNGEVDQKAIRQIKVNLSVLSHRYSELEQRFLVQAARGGAKSGFAITLPGGLDLMMMNLMEDGLVHRMPDGGAKLTWSQPEIPEFPMAVFYLLTDKGAAFVQNWQGGRPLE